MTEENIEMVLACPLSIKDLAEHMEGTADLMVILMSTMEMVDLDRVAKMSDAITDFTIEYMKKHDAGWEHTLAAVVTTMSCCLVSLLQRVAEAEGETPESVDTKSRIWKTVEQLAKMNISE